MSSPEQSIQNSAAVDVLCVGHASYDLIFSVPHHPLPDEKLFADGFIACGGGPAANAAVMVAKLGGRAAFAGFLSNDIYGAKHYQEFQQHQVNVGLVRRGDSPTPISVVIVKPDGQRALVNYKGETHALPDNSIDFSALRTRTILFDGHEPHISMPLADKARALAIPTILDAGSVHAGTLALMTQVDYLVASEKFACQIAGTPEAALKQLARQAPTVVITLGEHGLIWQQGSEFGTMPAFQVEAIDTTGAGDAFHGAFAAALAADLAWQDLLSYASAAGALTCTKIGARLGLPDRTVHQALFEQRHLIRS